VGPEEGEEVLVNGNGGRTIVGISVDSLEGVNEVVEGAAVEAADEATDETGAAEEATEETTDETGVEEVAADEAGPAVAVAEAPSARV
jgi:hypothetical protein